MEFKEHLYLPVFVVRKRTDINCKLTQIQQSVVGTAKITPFISFCVKYQEKLDIRQV